MLQSRWLAALVVVCGLGMPVFGQDVKLEWKFEKGKKFYEEVTTQTTQDMTVSGQKQTQTQKQTYVFSWEPIEEKDKVWTIKQKIEQVKVEIQLGGAPISYDSTKPAEAAGANNPLGEFFKNLLGAEFTVKIGADMKVIEVKGGDDLINKLKTTNPTMEPLLKQILSNDALKQMADPAFGMLPDKAVKKGDSWDKASKLSLGPIGTYDNKYKYTLENVDKDVATIKVDATVTYTPPGAGASGSLPFRIQNADLKNEKTEGKIEFNVKEGRLVSSKISQKLKGKLNIEISGMTSDVMLEQDQTTNVKTMDKLETAPAAPPKPEK